LKEKGNYSDNGQRVEISIEYIENGQILFPLSQLGIENNSLLLNYLHRIKICKKNINVFG